MQKLTMIFTFLLAVSLCSSPSIAETYFLKISQANKEDVESQKTYLQTCATETSPCTFMIPVKLESGEAKNIAVVMRIKESPYIYLQFYWDQSQLATNNSGEAHYTLPAGTKATQTEPRTIQLYKPVHPEQAPPKNNLVLRFSNTPIANLTATATMTEK